MANDLAERMQCLSIGDNNRQADNVLREILDDTAWLQNLCDDDVQSLEDTYSSIHTSGDRQHNRDRATPLFTGRALSALHSLAECGHNTRLVVQMYQCLMQEYRPHVPPSRQLLMLQQALSWCAITPATPAHLLHPVMVLVYTMAKPYLNKTNHIVIPFPTYYLPRLLALMQHEDVMVRGACLQALELLSNTQPDVLEHGHILSHICTLLNTNCIPTVASCIRLMTNLAEENQDTALLICKEPIFNYILQHCSSKSNTIQIEAVRALKSIVEENGEIIMTTWPTSINETLFNVLNMFDTESNLETYHILMDIIVWYRYQLPEMDGQFWHQLKAIKEQVEMVPENFESRMLMIKIKDLMS